MDVYIKPSKLKTNLQTFVNTLHGKPMSDLENVKFSTLCKNFQEIKRGKGRDRENVYAQ